VGIGLKHDIMRYVDNHMNGGLDLNSNILKRSENEIGILLPTEQRYEERASEPSGIISRLLVPFSQLNTPKGRLQKWRESGEKAGSG